MVQISEKKKYFLRNQNQSLKSWVFSSWAVDYPVAAVLLKKGVSVHY
jgi:hypothetical protein